MSLEMNILYEPDSTKLKLPRFHTATIVHNGSQETDSSSLIENLGILNVNDTFSLRMTSFVHNVNDDTFKEVPLNQESDKYSYKKFLSIEQPASLPSGITFTTSGDDIIVSGKVNNISSPQYEFLLRVTLEVYDKNSSDLVRVDVYERYFYFTSTISEDSFFWSEAWLSGQMTNEIDNQTVYFLGSWAKGETVSIPMPVSNPANLPLKYSIESTGFTNQLESNNPILPRGLRLDDNLGSIGGSISISNKAGYYYFKVLVKNGNDFGKTPTNTVIFVIQIQNLINAKATPNDSVVWVTPVGSLGNSYSTYPSHFSVEAKNPASQQIQYSISPNSYPLPSDMTINPDNGLITGRCPFVTSTTVYQITVRATVNGNFADRAFSFKVLPLYATDSFLSVNIPITEQIRKLVTSWAWNTNVTPEKYIFRISDSNFSRTVNPMILVANGLTSSPSTIGYWYYNPDNKGSPEPENGTLSLNPDLTQTSEDYWHSCFLDKLRGYHRPFNLRIGKARWAPGYDPEGNYIYDMVYMEVYDPNADQLAFSNGIEQYTINPTNSLQNSTFTSNIDMNHSFYQIPNSDTVREYPVCLMNCRLDLITTSKRIMSPTYYRAPNATPGIGLDGQEGLPFWMKNSPSSDGSVAPLGYVAAIPLVYVLPTYGELVMINLEQLGAETELSGQEFTVDRYIVSSSTEKWIIWDPDMNPTTTFDNQSVPPISQTLFDVRLDTQDQVVLFPSLGNQ